MIPLRNVPGRIIKLVQTSPPPYRPKLRLTKKRREIIQNFKRLHPKRLRGSGRLFRFMIRHDSRIQRTDVDRWIKRNPWIWIKVEVMTRLTFRVASPSPLARRQRRRLEKLDRILNMREVSGELHFQDEENEIFEDPNSQLQPQRSPPATQPSSMSSVSSFEKSAASKSQT